MKELFSLSLKEVINMSASSDPTPGGGSVSAICAAFAASMAAMVGNLTIGKKKYKDVEDKVTELDVYKRQDPSECQDNRGVILICVDAGRFISGSEHVVFVSAFLEKLAAEITENILCLCPSYGFATVSYTHLDVYKRQ